MLEDIFQTLSHQVERSWPIGKSDSDLHIKIYVGKAGLNQIRMEWTAITDRMVGRRHYFHLWEWHRDYLDTLVDEPDAAIFIVVYLAAVPMVILPLQVSTVCLSGYRLRVIQTPHHKHMPFCDMICDPSPVHYDIPVHIINFLRTSVRNSWDVLYLRGILTETSSLCRWGRALQGPRLLTIRNRCDSLRYSSHEEMKANVSRKFLNNLRYARKKLNILPDVEFRFIRDPAFLQEAYTHFLEVESSGWKGSCGSGTAIALNQEIENFYHKILCSHGSNSICQINLLMLAGKCIAGQFCLRLDKTLYVLKIGYSENHANLSPGHLLMEESIILETNSIDPINCWNLLGCLDWLSVWKPRHEEVCDLVIYNNTVIGHAMYFWTRVTRIIRIFSKNILGFHNVRAMRSPLQHINS